MYGKTASAVVGMLVLIGLLSATGCNVAYGPNIGMLGWPIPVSPYFQDQQEDNFWNKERYEKVPILGPIVGGSPPVAMDPPSDDQILRALEKARPLEGGIPLMHEIQRDNVRIVKELIDDSVDPEPRVVPLAGPVLLHHSRWRCTVYFSETTHVGWPLPYTTVNEDAQEVIYIDKSHFHMVPNVAGGGPTSNY